MLSMCLACWTAHVAAVHAHLRVVGMYGGTCCLADWCNGSVLPYPPLNASNSHFFKLSECYMYIYVFVLNCLLCCLSLSGTLLVLFVFLFYSIIKIIILFYTIILYYAY